MIDDKLEEGINIVQILFPLFYLNHKINYLNWESNELRKKKGIKRVIERVKD